jgi:hypothetical protein
MICSGSGNKNIFVSVGVNNVAWCMMVLSWSTLWSLGFSAPFFRGFSYLDRLLLLAKPNIVLRRSFVCRWQGNKFQATMASPIVYSNLAN